MQSFVGLEFIRTQLLSTTSSVTLNFAYVEDALLLALGQTLHRGREATERLVRCQTRGRTNAQTRIVQRFCPPTPPVG